MNSELQRQVEPFLNFLQKRFETKIGKDNYYKYYLAYSGGKDSHFLYWFIKEYLHDEDIEIVSVNTGFELPEIRDRILKYSDTVLHPAKSRWEIKENYGIPCYSKQQDEYIYRYQRGNRSDNTMRAVNGENIYFNLNKQAREKLLSGELHKVSNRCCIYSKEKPMQKYAREKGRLMGLDSLKAIIGVRGAESRTRKAKYNQCMKSNGDFTPIYDFSDKLMDDIYEAYDIEIPSCYDYLTRTGCAGCPYGKNVALELSLLPRLQQMNAIKYFKESYDAKGIHYRGLQTELYTYPLETKT